MSNESAAGVMMSGPKEQPIARKPYVPVPPPPRLRIIPVPPKPRAVVDVDVHAIRKQATGIGYTQETFADAIGVSVKTVRNWEQGRRKPTGPARVLLSLIARNPRIVLDTLKRNPATPAE